MDMVNVALFGKDPKIQRSLAIARNVSVTKSPVLIAGEVGVGKKSLGRFIHQNSNRAEQEVAVVDCAQEAGDVENQILGHRDQESGRFIKGVLESANGGTVIFANIDSLEEDFQKRLHKILTQLDDFDIDIRIVATTTKNLSKLVGGSRFYRGLFTLVTANQITLSPLRDRVTDLEEIARLLVGEFSENREIEIDAGVVDKIVEHYWTHNVEELKGVIESSLDSCGEESVLTEEHLTIGNKNAVSSISLEDNDGIRLMSIKDAEKLLIKKALIHTSENRTQAAKILGVSIRTLRNKINEYRNGGSSYFVNLR
jgi:two-component system, response regulator FlrC